MHFLVWSVTFLLWSEIKLCNIFICWRAYSLLYICLFNTYSSIRLLIETYAPDWGFAIFALKISIKTAHCNRLSKQSMRYTMSWNAECTQTNSCIERHTNRHIHLYTHYTKSNMLGVSVKKSDRFLSMLTQYYMRQGCVAVMSTTWIASVAIFGVLVLPRGGYYFNASGLLACDPFFARASLRYRHYERWW